MIIDFLQEVISTLILNSFLAGLFILSLWHNYITVHFKKKHDPRDIRKASTTIHRHDHEGKTHELSQQTTRRGTRASVSSRSPLNIEINEENNIEYDHTISVITTGDTMERVDRNDNGNINNNDNGNVNNHINSNPFDDVLAMEDKKLVPSLKYYYNQYNIDIEEYQVETDDGFIIDLWHFVPLNMTIQEKEKTYNEKYPILMVHGLLQSSGSFASCGRKSLAYYMYESGFDVWLGNNRCGFNPKWNIDKLKKFYGKESKLKFKKWDWDINEMIKYDIKSFIEFILDKKPNFDKLTLMSHSQGTTQAFMGLVNGPIIYNGENKSEDDDNENVEGFSLLDKLDNYVALAPAIYPGPLLNEKIFVRLMGAGIDSPWIFGKKSFIPLMMQMRNVFVGSKPFSFLSYVMFNYLFDWNDMLWDKSLRDRNFLFSPVNISVKLMQWWLSPDPTKNSFKYGADKIFPPEKTWFPISSKSNVNEDEGTNTDGTKPFRSPLHLNKTRNGSEFFPRIMLFIPKQDRLVDGEKLINHFINHEDKSLYKIWYIDEYSHLDVLWAYDVIDRIGKPILDNMRLPYDMSE
ncbi:sterol esterase PWA37_003468 [Arxiozyma heterogenica]|uniref:sterol esterase n=1 Tax=Arxiozyma heterogenica TaxID=278026 RepID=UPI002EDC7DEB